MTVHENEPAAEQDEFVSAESINIEYFKKILQAWGLSMLHYYKFALTVLFLLLLITAYIYMFGKQTFTATAVIGPPNPSPSSSLLSGGTGLSGITRLGGGSTNNDIYQEYQFVMMSTQMTDELIASTDFLQILLPQRWDAANKKWRGETSSLGHFVRSIKQALRRPISEYPDSEVLNKYLKDNLVINQAQGPSGGGQTLKSLSNGPTYLTVKLTAPDSPQKAEYLLSLILKHSDSAIRRELLRDVNKRISYINGELQKTNFTEQKDSLISVLTGQQSLKVMLSADERFSYVLVSSPKASAIPASPPGPSKLFLLDVFLSLILEGLFVSLKPYSPFVRRFLRFFHKPK